MLKLIVPVGIVLAVTALAVTSAQAAAAKITPKPAVGHPSAVVKVVGTGFAISTGVTVEFDGASVATTTSDSGGGFTTTFTVPASATVGVHTVSATDGTSTAQHTFKVETDWNHFGFDNNNSGDNPYENVISTSNIPTPTPEWTFTTGGYVAQPAIVGGVAYFGSTDHKLYAVDAKTGAIKWSFTAGDNITTTPVVVGPTVYFGSIDHYLYAVDKANGQQQWRTDLHDKVLSSPTVSKGVIYVGSNNHQLIALDTAGNVLWGSTDTGGIVEDSPTVVGNTVYVGSNGGDLYAFRTADGSIKWHKHYDGQTTTDPTVYPFSYSPAYVNGVLYVTDGPFAHAVKAASGAKMWTWKLHFGKTAYPLSGPAVANGHVYLGATAGDVESLNATTGALEWQKFIQSANQQLTTANGVLFLPEFGSTNLDALDASNGAVLRQWPEGTPLSGFASWTGAAISDGVVYAGATDGKLYALKP